MGVLQQIVNLTSANRICHCSCESKATLRDIILMVPGVGAAAAPEKRLLDVPYYLINAILFN